MCSCMGPSRILTFSSIVSEKMGTGDCDSLQMIVPLLLESEPDTSGEDPHRLEVLLTYE